MFKLTRALAIIALLAPTIGTFAEEKPPKVDQPKEDSKRPDRGPGGGREEFFKRMQEENPELKGIDLNSPEGQEKLRAAMQKRKENDGAKIRELLAKGKATSMAELNKQFDMKPEEFAAIEPLIERVENLISQRDMAGMFDMGTDSRSPFGDSNNRLSSFFNPKLLLGDTKLEPEIQEIQDATKMLKTINADPQANETEVMSALTRLRKARDVFSTLLKNAQNDLRSVLTRKQESILVERGILE